MTVHSFKEVMANYPTGVTVVTTFDGKNEPVGLTVNSFASVSIEPLLVLWSIGKESSNYETFKQVDRFTINILAHHQKDVAFLFASREQTESRFKKCNWHQSEHQLPVLENVAAALQCQLYQRVEAGDHMILIGEVIEITHQETLPLLYHQRKMGAFPIEF